MAHHISKRELEMLERGRRNNCGDEGYKYTHGRHFSNRVVSDRQRRKVEREKRMEKLKRKIEQSPLLLDNMETRVSRRQRVIAPVRPATITTFSATKPTFQKQPRQSFSTKAKAVATARARANTTGDIQAVSVGGICVKTKADTSVFGCLITGSVMLPDDKLILADWHNHKVKLLNLLTSTVTAEMKTSAAPFNITNINGNTVAVTVPYSRKIMFVKVTDKLKLDRELPVDGECRGILYSNGNLIVSYRDPIKIEIMSLDGTAKRKLAHFEKFKAPGQMALSQDNKTIYVSYYYGHCVKKLSLDGFVETVYEDEVLNAPTGIVSIGKEGRLLVCGHGIGLGNIQLLEPDLTKVKVLLHGIDNLYSLSYCNRTGRLYVGGHGGEGNIKVYQLS